MYAPVSSIESYRPTFQSCLLLALVNVSPVLKVKDLMMTSSAIYFISLKRLRFGTLSVICLYTFSHNFSNEQSETFYVVFVTCHWNKFVLSIAAALTWHNPLVMTHFVAIIAKYNIFLKWYGVLSNYTPETNQSIFRQLWNFEMGKIYIRNFWIVSWMQIFLFNTIFRAVCSSGPGSSVGWSLEGEGGTIRVI